MDSQIPMKLFEETDIRNHIVMSRKMDIRNKETDTGSNGEDEGLRHDSDEPLTETNERKEQEDPSRKNKR